MGFSFFVLGYITKSTVMICPSVKICEFFFSNFFTAGMSTVSEPRRRRVGKVKKKGHRSDTGVRRVVLVL